MQRAWEYDSLTEEAALEVAGHFEPLGEFAAAAGAFENGLADRGDEWLVVGVVGLCEETGGEFFVNDAGVEATADIERRAKSG